MRGRGHHPALDASARKPRPAGAVLAAQGARGARRRFRPWLEVVRLLRRLAARGLRALLGQLLPLVFALAGLGPGVAPGLDRLLVVLEPVLVLAVAPAEVVALADALEHLGEVVGDAETVLVLEVQLLELIEDRGEGLLGGGLERGAGARAARARGEVGEGRGELLQLGPALGRRALHRP